MRSEEDMSSSEQSYDFGDSNSSKDNKINSDLSSSASGHSSSVQYNREQEITQSHVKDILMKAKTKSKDLETSHPCQIMLRY